jgi:hypothetical protein
MKAGTETSWLWTAAAIVLMCVLGGVMLGGEEKSPSAVSGKVAPKAQAESAAQKTPAGPPWPQCWDFKFSMPDKIVVGEPFVMKVSITPMLFDMTDLETVPMAAGEGLKMVENAAGWKGTLKKGETKEFQLKLVASKEGPNGQGGVAFISPGFYKQLREYITTQVDGPYATANAKKIILERLSDKEKLQPQYVDVAGTVIVAGKREVK